MNGFYTLVMECKAASSGFLCWETVGRVLKEG